MLKNNTLTSINADNINYDGDVNPTVKEYIYKKLQYNKAPETGDIPVYPLDTKDSEQNNKAPETGEMPLFPLDTKHSEQNNKALEIGDTTLFSLDASEEDLYCYAAKLLKQIAPRQSDLFFRANQLAKQGQTYSDRGEHDKAIDCLTESLNMMKSRYDKSRDGNTANALDTLGRAYAAKNDYDKAIECHTESLNMRLAHSTEPRYNVVKVLKRLGDAYEKKDEHDKAIDYYTKSLTMMELLYGGENNNNFAVGLIKLGDAYEGKDNHGKAINCYDRALYILTDIKASPENMLTIQGKLKIAKEKYDQTNNEQVAKDCCDAMSVVALNKDEACSNVDNSSENAIDCVGKVAEMPDVLDC
ncbi:MAG: tetratricopeptide repeat protein [Rickettsia endosymbiont of Labidopullus appendiculatus]|nr:tetratricopeptide repeat protein [Rickettsia endosymbiont of Labidopullus appendiculatus]